MERSLVAHGMADGILHDGLHDEARDLDRSAARLDSLGLDDTILTEARLLDLEVATGLLELLAERYE